MSFNVTSIISHLRAGLELAKTFMPIVKELPGGELADKVSSVVTAALDVAQNVQTRVAEAEVVVSAQDQETIKSIVDELATINDGLNAEIAGDTEAG